MAKTFYTLKNDIVFKNVFLKDPIMAKWLIEGTINIIKDNLKESFTIFDINKLYFLNGELMKDAMFIRNKNVDGLIVTNNAYFNIELNNKFYKITKMRNFFYQTSYLNSTVHINQSYVIKKPIIQFNYNIHQEKTNDLLNYISLFDGVSFKNYLKVLYIFNFDIERLIDKWYNELNEDSTYFEKYKYLLIIGMNEEQLKNLKVSDIMINKIIKKITKLNRDPKFYEVLTKEEDDLYMKNSLYEEGIEEGKLQGIEEERKYTALKMREKNISIDTISDITGLDKNVISML